MKLLSHSLSEETPLYAGERAIYIKPMKQMNCGDSCNSLTLSFPNHAGTHIDMPRHFSVNGKTLTDYPVNFWFANKGIVIDVSAECVEGKLFGSEVLSSVLIRKIEMDESSIAGCEVVFFKTGFGQFRGEARYWQKGPGFKPELAGALREVFPVLRFVGFDAISLTSYEHRAIGRDAHRAFLDHERPLCIIEDMDLSDVRQGFIDNILISPMMLSAGDGAPCMVWADVGRT